MDGIRPIIMTDAESNDYVRDLENLKVYWKISNEDDHYFFKLLVWQ